MIYLFLRVFRKVLLIFIITPWCFNAAAQELEGAPPTRMGSSILDDTTVNIYGPTTTGYFYYPNVVNNTYTRYTIDTSVYDLHQFSFVDYHDKRFQDLGNIGTAVRPIYYRFPETIGITTGFDVYDLYFDDASEIRYYDTQAPYSRLGVILGGQGRAMTEATYTRNIDYRSNFAFNYRGLFVDKQIERARRGDRNAQGVYYNFNGNYRTKNGRYHAMAAVIRNNQKVDEYGGVRNKNPQTPLELFFHDTVKVRLANTRAIDLRREYFYYHEYHLTPLIEIFHEFKHYDQLVKLRSDINATPDREFFPDRIITDDEIEEFGGSDGDLIADRNKFDELSNKVGLAGTVGPGWYQVYYQNRDLNFDYRFLNEQVIDTLNLPHSHQQENLAGAMVRIGTENDMFLAGQLDYAEGGYYNIAGSIALKYFYGSIRQMKRRPAYIESAYRSNFNEWYLNPKGPVTSELNAGVLFETDKFRFDGGATFQRLTDYIYFSKEGDGRTRAFQNEGTVTALLPHVNASLWLGTHWLLKGEAIYSVVGGKNPEVYPLPELFTNLQFSYNDISFQGNLEWQLGVDYHYKSPYFAPGYDPLIQQFYIQQEFLNPGVPIIDVFLNAKINRARLFVKYTNLFQMLAGYGYFPTPYYPGQVATLDFGFNWSFYD